MPGGIFVLPNIVRTVRGPLIYKLVVIASPAIAHAKIIVGLVVGIVNVVNGDRHAIAGEAKTVVYPNEISGIVVDVSGTGGACAVRCIVPNVLQSAIVDIGDAQVLRGAHMAADQR